MDLQIEPIFFEYILSRIRFLIQRCASSELEEIQGFDDRVPESEIPDIMYVVVLKCPES